MKKFLVLATSLLMSAPAYALTQETVGKYFHHLVGATENQAINATIRNRIIDIATTTAGMPDTLGMVVFMEKFKNFLVDILTEEFAHGGLDNPQGNAIASVNLIISSVARQQDTEWQYIHPTSLSQGYFTELVMHAITNSVAEATRNTIKNRGQIPVNRSIIPSTAQVIFTLEVIIVTCDKTSALCKTLLGYLKANDPSAIVAGVLASFGQAK